MQPRGQHWVESQQFTAQTGDGDEITVAIGCTHDGALALRIGTRHTVYLDRETASKLGGELRDIVARAIDRHGW